MCSTHLSNTDLSRSFGSRLRLTLLKLSLHVTQCWLYFPSLLIGSTEDADIVWAYQEGGSRQKNGKKMEVGREKEVWRVRQTQAWGEMGYWLWQRLLFWSKTSLSLYIPAAHSPRPTGRKGHLPNALQPTQKQAMALRTILTRWGNKNPNFSIPTVNVNFAFWQHAPTVYTII